MKEQRSLIQQLDRSGRGSLLLRQCRDLDCQLQTSANALESSRQSRTLAGVFSSLSLRLRVLCVLAGVADEELLLLSTGAFSPMPSLRAALS